MKNQAKEQKGKGKSKGKKLSNPHYKEDKGKGKANPKAKVRESQTREKGKLTHPSLPRTRARESNSSFPKANNGAAYASKRGILHKLAGGIRNLTSSSHNSTRKEQLGLSKVSLHLHKLGVNNLGPSKLLLSGLAAIKLCNGWAVRSLSFTA